MIRVHTLTEATGEEATTALDLLDAVKGPLVRVTADAASDTVALLRDCDGAGCDSRHPTVLGCEILNRMTALGRPVSSRIGR